MKLPTIPGLVQLAEVLEVPVSELLGSHAAGQRQCRRQRRRFRLRARLRTALPAAVPTLLAGRAGPCRAARRLRWVFVHLTAQTAAVHARLLARDGTAPGLTEIDRLVAAYHRVFVALAAHAPVIQRDLGAGSAEAR